MNKDPKDFRLCLTCWSLNHLSFTVLCTDTVTSCQAPQSRDTDSPTDPYPLQPQHHSPCILPEPFPGENTHCTGSLVSGSPPPPRMLAEDTCSGSSRSSSPGLVMDHILEYLDSEPEHDGIFLDFSQHCSEESRHSRDSSRQSVAWHTQDTLLWCRDKCKQCWAPWLTFLPPCDAPCCFLDTQGIHQGFFQIKLFFYVMVSILKNKSNLMMAGWHFNLALYAHSWKQ